MSEKLQELLKLKSGGTYVPPSKLRALMADIELEANSEEFQKLQWENLRRKINSIINKVNKDNIKELVVQLFRLNLIRGRGLLCNSLMKSQQLSTAYTNVYSSLVSILNSKIPEIGALLIARVIVRFRRLIRREEIDGCKSIVVFISELVVYHVCSHTLIMEIIMTLLENPNDFKIDMIINILNHCGVLLHDMEDIWFDKMMSILRNILNENIVASKSQFLIQTFFDDFKKNVDKAQNLDEDLDLVDEDDYVEHNISLKDRVQAEDQLDIFTYDKEYKANNEKYETLKKEILGSDGEEDDVETSEDEVNSDFSSDNEDEDEEKADSDNENEKTLTVQIKDLTEQELTNFQKNVYLTVMSSMGPEEATHKLLKLAPIDSSRKEYMLADMIVKCCAQEKVYSKYYGLIGENLIVINRRWSSAFQELFKENYENCYRYETALLRNIGAFWGHMLASDKLGWECLSTIKLTEEDTTSSGRIFVKFIFQKMLEELGIKNLLERIDEPYIEPFITGIFPSSDAEHLRFSINYFTAIGLGRLTDKMRESLENLPADVEAIKEKGESRGRSRSRSSSFSSSSSYSSSGRNSYSRSVSRSRSRSTERNEDKSGERGRSTEKDAGNSIANRERSFSRSRSSSPNAKRQRVNNIPRGPRGANRGRGFRNHYDRNNNYRGNNHRSGYSNRGNDYRRGNYNRGGDTHNRNGQYNPDRNDHYNQRRNDYYSQDRNKGLGDRKDHPYNGYEKSDDRK